MKQSKDKENLDKAIEILENLYYRVNNGCAFENGKLRLMKDVSAQKDIATFVKSVKKDTKLKVPKLRTYSCALA